MHTTARRITLRLSTITPRPLVSILGGLILSCHIVDSKHPTTPTRHFFILCCWEMLPVNSPNKGLRYSHALIVGSGWFSCTPSCNHISWDKRKTKNGEVRVYLLIFIFWWCWNTPVVSDGKPRCWSLICTCIILFLSHKWFFFFFSFFKSEDACPKNASYYGNRAATLMMLCRFREALEDSQQAVRLDDCFMKVSLNCLWHIEHHLYCPLRTSCSAR